MPLYHPATINTPIVLDRAVEATLERRRRLREIGFLEREILWMKMQTLNIVTAACR